MTASRFTDAWWRKFDKPTDGFYDSAGFMNRLPLRLESREAMVYGLVDPATMWKDYEDEGYVPILVGGKAVVSIWFNDFKDTDCGGSYLETWYNTFVTPKDKPIELEISWACDESGKVHQLVPAALHASAEQAAKDFRAAMDED